VVVLATGSPAVTDVPDGNVMEAHIAADSEAVNDTKAKY